MPTCPWCEADVDPQPTNLETAEFVYCAPSAEALRLNPLECPECHGVGGYEDWYG
jgi:hypothetical protein